ncbi:MAG TPA: UDP-N-acetylmuramoyl-L-alanine--D-glutamate ligase [Acidimicrobiales bacterium]|nr:UDP-N-acetylmuramoyl-L-alanine--D-glutamate ligase [Acidimicrobiales bacterium]
MTPAVGRGRVLVYGLGVSGCAAARHLLAEGVEIVAVDDDAGAGPRDRATSLGLELVVAPDETRLRALASGVDEIVVTPGIPAGHRVFGLGGGVRLVGEVELAWRRSRSTVVAVTGTNGKTTVTTLIAAMLVASGIRAVAAGNIGAPLLDAVAGDAEVVVAEVSSFQLALTDTFRPAVAAWVNFSEDHLDWHATVDAYRDAKARVWANSGPGDVVVANAEDPVVLGASQAAADRGAVVVTFGLAVGDFTVDAGNLVGPDGLVLAAVGELPRSLPHDLANALCAAAVSLAVGATPDGCRSALTAFRGLPHRVELVREASGVRYYDDSKATTPGAVLAALDGFPSAVLIAGGRNKGLDLSVLRGASDRLRGVVAIGEAASEVSAAFSGACMVVEAPSMAEAVRRAAGMARTGDAVVLSPACASFDWYSSYGARGDDFARCVRALDPPDTSTAGIGAPAPEVADR